MYEQTKFRVLSLTQELKNGIGTIIELSRTSHFAPHVLLFNPIVFNLVDQ